MIWHEFAIVAAAHFAAVASPGPDFAVVTKVSIKHGRRAGVQTALGIANGLAVHIIYCLVGFALLIKRTPWLFQTIRIAGALYLTWIAYNALKGAWHSFRARKSGSRKSQPITKMSAFKAWREGFLTNITNPKVTLFFLVIFTEVVSTSTPLWIRSLYGVEMVTATALWFSIIAYLINRKRFRRGYERLSWVFDGMLGLILLGLVVKIIL